MLYFEVVYLENQKKQINYIQANSKQGAIFIAKTKISGKILKLTEKPLPLSIKITNFKKKYFKKRVNIEAFIASIRQLGVMTNAGIPIQNSISEVTLAVQDKTIKEIFQGIDERLSSGMSLTEAMSIYKDELGEITLVMVELGENTGNISESLINLAKMLEDINDNIKKFKKALRYPITVVVAIVIAFTLLMVLVVPKFKSIFEQLGADLPLPTKVLLGAEYIISHFGIFILIAIFGLIFFAKQAYKTNENFRNLSDRYILKLYLIGDIVFYSSMSRFFLVLTELTKAGISITESLQTATKTIENSYIKKRFAQVMESISKGISFSQAVRETTLVESMLIQMISAGEASGTLDGMLGKVTDYYDSKFNELIDNISSYIEPILIGFIAAMVLLMALGIFMPMWDMAAAVKH